MLHPIARYPLLGSRPTNSSTAEKQEIPMTIRTNAPTRNRRHLSPRLLALLAAIAIVLSTALGPADASAGRHQGDPGRMIISGSR
jgi:hypothetical protein